MRATAIQSLLAHPRVAQYPAPRSPGGVRANREQAGANLKHQGDSAEDTADFNDKSVGNLRRDYALPSTNLEVRASGVFWPDTSQYAPALSATLESCLGASDHRLVWVDVLPLLNNP